MSASCAWPRLPRSSRPIHCPEEIEGGRELCMAAVAKEFIQWREGDRELCMAAVAEEPATIILEEMEGDRELCMAVVVN